MKKPSQQIRRVSEHWITTDGSSFLSEADAYFFQRLLNFRAWYSLLPEDARPMPDADEMFDWVVENGGDLKEIFGPWAF